MRSSSRRRTEERTFGPVLRAWRHQRGLSQLALALASQVSQRHISFLESGRSQPSPEMVLRLGTVLDVPLREQNVMLMAAGYAPIYQARELTDPEMAQVRKALEYMLHQQEPYPALVVDRHWHLRLANAASGRLLAWLIEPHKLHQFCNAAGHLNLLRLLFHPDGIRQFIDNWHDVAGHLIERLHREAVTDGPQSVTMELLNELLAYPDVPGNWQVPHWEAWQAPVLIIAFAKDELALRFFSTITTLGTPHDITLQELRLECFSRPILLPSRTSKHWRRQPRDVSALSPSRWNAAITSSTSITSPYLESMSNRLTRCVRRTRSATHWRGTMTRKPADTASTTVARTQPLVELPVTTTVSTPHLVRYECKCVP